ncbi:PREDICTED: uncharacterized protein At3g43530-like [Tarenaya hassleriana]|uniref:uncharacterized protein At3g43530-like n=1 Tax=Tarenaya hassleriana TaxID=28532 RepID=UPI0008FD577D|nr:PREDICTED: uncharacterized protein At3g43530-like [Tarenaya hassleriana]
MERNPRRSSVEGSHGSDSSSSSGEASHGSDSSGSFEKTDSHRKRTEDSSPDSDSEAEIPPKPEFYYDFDDMNTISVKVSSKCFHIEAVDFLEKYFTEEEEKHFTEKSQFRHLFHMKKKQTLKMSPMVALINRAVKTKRENELWFVINGVPIRYSLWEHTILCGLKGSKLPDNWETLGGTNLYRKYFGQESFEKVPKTRVMAMFSELPKDETDDRLKMAYLLLLSYVIGHQHSEFVNPFLLKIVDDVKCCETFPWGTFTFQNVLGSVHNYLNKHRKPVNQWNLPGFIIPLTMLPFECIPKLRSDGWYSEVKLEGNVTEACPRMCRRCFIPNKKYGMKQGLAKIGKTQDIESYLQPSKGEERLLRGVAVRDKEPDDVIDCWMAYLTEEPRSVKWHDILEEDVRSRIEVPLMKQQNKRKVIVSTRKTEKKRGKSNKGKRLINEYEEEEEEVEKERDYSKELTMLRSEMNMMRSEMRFTSSKVEVVRRKLVETEDKLFTAIEDQGAQIKKFEEEVIENMKKVIVAGIIASGNYDNLFEVDAKIDVLMKKMTETMGGNEKGETSAQYTTTPPETCLHREDVDGEPDMVIFDVLNALDQTEGVEEEEIVVRE